MLWETETAILVYERNFNKFLLGKVISPAKLPNHYFASWRIFELRMKCQLIMNVVKQEKCALF